MKTKIKQTERAGERLNRGREFANAALEIVQFNRHGSTKKQKINKLSQRRDNRICVIQFLYQWELNKPEELADVQATFPRRPRKA